MTETPAETPPGSEDQAPAPAPAAETPPDRLATNPKSPYFDAEPLSRGVGILFNGVEKTNVDEYCVSEGWVRLAVGKSLDRKGNPMTIKMNGTVLPFYRDLPRPDAA
ncbi:DUF3297 family protein [Sphingomonas sp. 1P06PA]|uniref:DUF3297 family protein n=1 Tax=Sphingomonas sp. 1P06PA TaxID=554121 RepID=UPI0039A56FA8